jgi:hypothetical protein
MRSDVDVVSFLLHLGNAFDGSAQTLYDEICKLLKNSICVISLP